MRQLRFLATLASLLLPPAATWAQAGAGTARLRGTLIDASTAQPVAGVRVVVGATGRFVVSDSAGAFEIRELPSGVLRFFFSKAGYPTTSAALAFAPGEIMVQAFEMDSTAATIAADTVGRRRVQMLPTEQVVAEAPRGVRFADFERRMRNGRGQYVTREQIAAAGYVYLTDALRMLRGVAVDCGAGRSCSARMARAPMRCAPRYWVDGRQDDMFGPYVPIGDIEGIEVYTGASDVPGEFTGSDSACGVIVIWTKSGPPPPRRP